MNKFLKYDDHYKIYRLPLGYSLGDLDTIRMIFGRHSDNASISLPILPPQLDLIDETGEKGYLVFPPVDLVNRIHTFMETTIQHLRRLKKKGYDYNHPDFKGYLEIRDDIIGFLSERIENIIEQERRLGVFNLFWLVVTTICVDCLNQAIAKLDASAETKFAVQPHVKSLLKQSMDQVYENFNYRDDLHRKTLPFYKSTIRTRLGSSFNFNFLNDMLEVQLCFLENTIPPVDPLHMIRKLLVEENTQYFITYKDYQLLYHSLHSWVESATRSGDEWLKSILHFTLGISEDIIDKLESNIVVFEPRFIFTVQDKIRKIPAEFPGRHIRKKRVADEIDERTFDQLLIDYIRIARELQKAEIITYFRNTIKLIGYRAATMQDAVPGVQALENRITYNLDGRTIINDLRSRTIMFVDLRASTELSSGVITSGQLIKTLYAFFDPALDVIAHYGGQIRFFAGDAILATFGDDNPSDRRILQAVEAGIAIQRMLAQVVLQNTMPLEGVGVGIHVGVLENAYIFSDERNKFNTVIGLSANLASRLSSGKSSSRERRADPLFQREISDLLQDILENTKNRISPNVRDDIVHIFDTFVGNEPDRKKTGRAFQKLPEIKDKPGVFRVNVVNGVLHNNGIVLSDTALKDLRKTVELTERPWRDSTEFVYFDNGKRPLIIFRPVGDAHLKGIPETTMVWSAQPAEHGPDTN